MNLEGEIGRLVKQIWGYDSLRPLQIEAVRASLDGRDSLVVLPTGGGKSLCYQIPPLVEKRTDIVVSPLISLMKDQVDGLNLVGYPAAAVHSGMKPGDQGKVLRKALAGEFRLLFVSPERIQTETFLNLARQLKIGSFAIDEAHCISHWGHDFRQDYRRLTLLREEFPKVGIHAFTATATPRVRKDIADQLGLREPVELVGRFDRPNLTYRVLPKTEVKKRVLEVIGRHPQEAVIVYCLSRNDTESLAAYLRESGVDAEPYHAGLPPQDRSRIQEAFSTEKLNVVAATVAFGMGIDRSNVRCIVHASMPKSIEQYQQETGRAGRDGLEAECVLFYSYSDVIRWQSLISSNDEAPPEIAAAQQALLDEIQAFCTRSRCRHSAISRYFGQPYEAPSCGACDVCLQEVDAVPESSTIAKKILSAVYRLEQRFGLIHLVEFLKGSDTERIRRNAHQRIKTYGALAELPIRVIREFCLQLVDQGFLDRTKGELPVLKLNQASLEILRGTRQASFRKPEGWSLSKTEAEEESWLGVDPGLFEELRGLRRDLAAGEGVPAFQVFSDKTLRELARCRPTSRESLLAIYGMGQVKARRFGSRLLEAIMSYCNTRDLASDVGIIRAPKPKKKKKAAGIRNTQHGQALTLLRQGLPLEEVARRSGRSQSTVADYLSEAVRKGLIASIDHWVDRKRQLRIIEAAREVGTSGLKPIYNRLGGDESYIVIRLVVDQLGHRDD
jgi:ATP-dependent DNA helicase RecQ